MGSHTDFANAVAVGDLDRDGKLDIVSGGADRKVNAWQNDGTPFDAGWSITQTVGSHTYGVLTVAVGDLDRDGKLDIVSGTYYRMVYAWQNPVAPFDVGSTWTEKEVGMHAKAEHVCGVAVGDLDGDGDLDIVSGATDNSVRRWQNPVLPFGTGTWTEGGVGTHGDDVHAVAVGDLDGDGDLDIVSGDAGAVPGGNHYVNAWQNQGGSAGFTVHDTTTPNNPATDTYEILDGAEDDVLKVVFTHNGIDGDRDLELNKFHLDLFQSNCTTALTSAQANAIIDKLRVRLNDADTGCETWPMCKT